VVTLSEELIFKNRCPFLTEIMVLMTTLRAEWSRIQIPAVARGLSLLQNVQPNLLFNGYETLFPGIKWPGIEVGHPPPSSIEVKNEWSSTSDCPICLHVVNGDNFFFYFYCDYTRLRDRQTYEED
jgi:hypothetical protein